MLKKILFAVVALIATMGFAFADVDVNKGDAAALDSIKGLGPATTKTILDERKKGDFKDWADFQKRVKGIGDKKAAALSTAGLTVNGEKKAGAPTAAPAKTGGKKEAKGASTPAASASTPASTSTSSSAATPASVKK
jgi:competence protein ComEA